MPIAFHRLEYKASIERYEAFENLGTVQSLATLKAFGQSTAKAKALAHGTMWVTAVNTLGRGIADASIDTATALAYGAWHGEASTMEPLTLLVVLMMGVELFRPLRDMRAQLHTGMLGQASAVTIFLVPDADPFVQESTRFSAIRDRETAGDDGPVVELEGVSSPVRENQSGAEACRTRLSGALYSRLSSSLTAFEPADPVGAPAFGGSDRGAAHEPEDDLLSAGVGDEVELPAPVCDTSAGTHPYQIIRHVQDFVPYRCRCA